MSPEPALYGSGAGSRSIVWLLAGLHGLASLGEQVLDADHLAGPTRLHRGFYQRDRLQVVGDVRLHRGTAVEPVHELLDEPGTQLCMNGSLEAPFEFLYDTDESAPFSIARPDWFVDDVVRTLVRKTPVFRTDLEGNGKVLRRRLKSILTREDENGQRVYPQHEATCIPVYRAPEEPVDTEQDSGDEGRGRLVLFFVQRPDEDTEPTEVTTETVWVR